MSVTAEELPPRSGAVMRLLPWALWLLVVGLTVAALVAFPSVPPGFNAYAYAIGLGWGVTASLIGALITSRRKGSIIGWLLVGLGLLVSLILVASRAGETDHPAADALNILSDVGWLASISLLTILILLFPDGRPLSPRWRSMVWFAALAPLALLLIAAVFAPQAFLSDERSSPLQIVVSAFLVVMFVGSTASALLRFTRSRGTERQQLKWFAYGTAVGIACALLGSLLPDGWGGVVANLGIYGPLAGIAVALFRHRLYDIDELISRTFVYGSLVAILAGVYSASIRLFNALFVDVTGVGSEEVLVITTLILATTFTPIKKRLEEIVERRYRKPTEEAALSADAHASADLADPAVSRAFEGRLRAIVRDELARSSRAT
jgi:hypothetical protein